MLGALGQAQAATFTVNSTDSALDGTCNIAHCSLDDAITEANLTVGADTIEFNILPGGTTHVLQRLTALPAITEAVTIDGYTQPGASANTLAFQDVDTVIRIELRAITPLVPTGLQINATSVTIRGLAIVNFADNISVSGTSSGVIIAGNFIGTQADGMTAMSSSRGVFIDYGLGVTIGGSNAADRNVISGNSIAGIDLERDAGSGPVNVIIRGNLIGTDPTAHATVPNGDGIRISTLSAIALSTDSIVIGGLGNLMGMGIEDGNIIGGNTGHGISISRSAGTDVNGSTLKIQRNSIGADFFLEAPMGNGGDGVRVSGPVMAQVIEGSLRYNGGAGVNVLGPVTGSGRGVLVQLNDIFGNAGLGIDLGGDGRTLNDADDSDTGPNNLLNFPIITSAVADGVSHAVDMAGTFRAAPNTGYVVHLYNVHNFAIPPGGNAWHSIGSVPVTTDINGVGVFSRSQNNVASPGDGIAAILYDLTNNLTSEIGDAYIATASAPSISGWVEKSGGGILMGISVQLSGTESRTAITNNNGHYQFDNVTMGGSYTVTPQDYGYSFAPASRSYANLTVGQRQDFTATLIPATYSVNVTHDNGDGACTPAECTLREAIDDANQHPGPDVIHFAIPGAGPHVIALASALPGLDDDLVIDGYTQAGASANTRATGGLNSVLRVALSKGTWNAQFTTGLNISGERVTVRGLVIAGFDQGINLVGLAGARDVVIEGNYLGTTPDGLAAVPGSGSGITALKRSTMTVGGTTPASRNLISGHINVGIMAQPGDNGQPSSLIVKGNLIGTDATGLAALGNATGILFVEFNPVVPELDVIRIGGETASEGNIISGNVKGIELARSSSDLDATDHLIAGNAIGVAADRETPLGNSDFGIQICGQSKVRIKRNIIAHNGGAGVSVCGMPTAGGFGADITENRIFANTGAAIMLGTNGRTVNDAGDVDFGPNGLQNYPVITSAQEQPFGTTFTGTLESLPNRTYRIEVFTTGTSNALAAGHAHRFITYALASTDPNGVAVFTAGIGTFYPVGEYVVATATDVAGMMTSELSDPLAIAPAPTLEVSGTITFNGAPLPNITVNVTGSRETSTQTGVDGRYSLNLPEHGSYAVTPVSNDYRFTPANAQIAALTTPTVIDFSARVTTHTRYLSEGAAGPFWRTSIAILNGTLVPTNAEVEFLKQDGTRETTTVPLAGPGHAVIDTAAFPGLANATFSTLITSEQKLVASRTMRWGEQAEGGAHAEQAVAEPLTTWYFAEGATGCFDLFYLLVNPGSTPAQVQITFVRRAPEAPIVREYTVGAFSRATVGVNGEEGLGSAEVSARITSSQPIVAERSMYASCFGTTWRGGHEGAAIASASTDWFFAEGATGSFFDFYLLLANFENRDANVDVEYLLEDGSTLKKRHVVPAGSRISIDVAGESPLLAQASVSAIVRSKNGVPLLAERSQWWPHGVWYEGHVSSGVAQTGIEWQMAGAQVGGPYGSEAFLLIANTSDDNANAQVKLVFDDGTTATAEAPAFVPAHGRKTIILGQAFPQAVGRTFGVIVESLGDVPAPIVVELSTYNDTPQTDGPNGAPRFWGAGTNVVATRVR
jgi:hypothetical protein